MPNQRRAFNSGLPFEPSNPAPVPAHESAGTPVGANPAAASNHEGGAHPLEAPRPEAFPPTPDDPGLDPAVLLRAAGVPTKGWHLAVLNVLPDPARPNVVRIVAGTESGACKPVTVDTDAVRRNFAGSMEKADTRATELLGNLAKAANIRLPSDLDASRIAAALHEKAVRVRTDEHGQAWQWAPLPGAGR